MNQIRLTDISHSYFQEAWKLYEESFPLEERRLISCQKDIMNYSYYHFEVLIQENRFVGFLLWWEFENIRFIEHLATMPHQRGMGYGKQIVKQFTMRDSRRIILEVELPDTEMKKRRIQFYQNLGFKLNNHFYKQPPIREGSDAVELLLMSYPFHITEEFVSLFVKDYHPVVYGRMR